jgi:hypothetical protein
MILNKEYSSKRKNYMDFSRAKMREREKKNIFSLCVGGYC